MAQPLNKQYIALLRGINVGGHHKVAMESLRTEFSKMGFENILTILNSGNVIFTSATVPQADTENHLQQAYGFPIPTVTIAADDLHFLVDGNPFAQIAISNTTRLYVSFLKNKSASIDVPPLADGSFAIVKIEGQCVFSVLDLAVSESTKGMDALEKIFGKQITTRNWNTVQKIAAKLNPIA